MVEQAIDAKIPVFVLDRNVDTDQYTQFVGGDNALIGRAAGEYAVELLGGAGKAAGNVVEIWGGMGTQPAHDRHDGFHEFTDKEPGIKYLLDQQSGDWKQDQAYNIMATALRNNEKIDLVYGHNDPMAYGAYLAAKDAGREKEIKFIGIDALPDEGVTWVQQRRADRHLPLRDAGRGGPAPGDQVPERREGAEDRHPRHHAGDQGQRRRDPQGQRPDVTPRPAAGLVPRPAAPAPEPRMDWLNEPPDWADADGTLAVVTGDRTDFWRKTHYGFIRDDGHFRHAAAPDDFSATVSFRGAYQELYDQAGLMLRLDAATWIKTGIEFVAGRRMLSAVVTRDVSDWSTMPMPSDADWVRLRLTRIGSAVHVHWAAGEMPHLADAAPRLVPAGRRRGSGRCAARRSGPGSRRSSATSRSGRRPRRRNSRPKPSAAGIPRPSPLESGHVRTSACTSSSPSSCCSPRPAGC